MPSPVPAGYTRGPILFIGAASSRAAEESLLQRFWNEAGAYGSRMVLLGVGGEGIDTATRAARIFNGWESDSVEVIPLETRGQALALDASGRMEHGTAVLLAGDNPLQLAAILGGTPAAQVMRRMNARSKVICTLGGGASFLCQHMLAGTQGAAGKPLLHRNLVHFAPGMGLLNSIAIDVSGPEAMAADMLPRLLTAVAHNPYLVGVGLVPDTGIVVYPNAVLEVFGAGSAPIVDGAHVSDADLYSGDADAAASLIGATVHVLTAGYTFNFDTHRANAPRNAEADISLGEAVRKSAY